MSEIKQSIKDNIPIDGKVKRDVSVIVLVLQAWNTFMHEEDTKIFENAKKELKAEIKDNESEIYNDFVSVKEISVGLYA